MTRARNALLAEGRSRAGATALAQAQAMATAMAMAMAIPALCLLAACSSTKKADKPMELVAFPQQFTPHRVWSASIGDIEPKLRLGLAPIIDGQRVYAANARGVVYAFDLATGRHLWQRRLRANLAGGPGAGEGLVVVGSAGGAVIALAASDGAERWRAQLNSEILSAPVVAGEVVLVRTVDGKLYGLAAGSGQQRWVTDQQVPRISLRGTGRPVIAGELVITGFDNGRLMAVTLGGGTTAWDVAVSQARGSSELQRLIDIDGAPVVDGDEVYVVGFQGRVARLERDSGREVWSRELSSYRGLALDPLSVLLANADGEVVRLDRAGGGERWRQKGLLRRALTAPAVLGSSVVVADRLGVIHWLSIEDGSFQARAKAGAPVTAAPLVAGNLLLLQTDKGSIQAWRASAR
jgi:outer membrane protein assembly factor BamB